MTRLFVIGVLLCVNLIFSQERKQKVLEITRVTTSPKIDADLNESAWKNANEATDFVMFRPDDGTREPDNIRSVVKVIYDDEAIYFGAYLYDDKPEEIPMEFQTRDNFGNADFFGVVLNPQNDGINQFEFFVMSTGNQNDAQVTTDGEDWSWNAVWESKVKLVEDGWIVEMKIPYSALRFSNEEIQTWSLNFQRQHRKNRDQYSWNYIDKKKGRISQYDGLLTGIKNIKPPVRLSINPYIFGAVADFDNKTEYIWNAGMDIKYGLSENFTLDATLIPDFGQAAFDNIRLNLGPFEQRFSENRAFFTEGTDLFNKGRFFYSRRVGGTPIGNGSVNVNANETITDNPNKADLINAIKISGRTKGGLGIGVFNAITETTKAIIRNNDNETTREVITEPLANYSVLVLDQQFNKNSSVSFVNTNVLRNGSFRDANVSGLLFDLNNKNNSYGVNGGVGMSSIMEEATTTGIQGNLTINKTSGKHRGGIGFDFRNKKYDQNDLGFQRKNNIINYEGYYSYRILKPTKTLNNLFVNFYTELKYLLKLDETTSSFSEKPNLYTGNFSNLRLNATTKKQLSFGGSIKTTLGHQYDYYLPNDQLNGRFYRDKAFIGYDFYVSTDYSKKFAVDLYFFRGVKYDGTKNYNNIRFSPKIRFNDKFNLGYSFEYVIIENDKGLIYSYLLPSSVNDIIFGNRDEKNITNSLSGKYNFNTKSALNLTFRHNWNFVTYDKFFKLNYDGTLGDTNVIPQDPNVNFNSWNIDLNFKWEFAPGSELVALYRNQIGNYDNQSHLKFRENLDNLFQQEQLNSLSLKIVYYLDYNSVKKWL